MRPERRKYIGFVLLLIGIVFAVYANTITGEFVWDDQTIVVRNDAIKSFHNLAYIFKNEFAEKSGYNGNVYRPIQELSFMIDYFLWGLDSTGFHITNILLQIACVIFLFYLVLNISESAIVAFITAAIFGVHPVNTEAISYISGRSDPLYFLFLTASFLFYIKSRGVNKWGYRGAYLLSILFYTVSLLSRETALVLPLLLVCYEKWIAKAEKANLYKLLPFFIILVLYGFLRLNLIEFETGKLQPLSLNAVIFTDIKLVFQYLRLLLFPFGLHMERRVLLSNSLDNMVVLSLLVIIPLLVFAFRAKNKQKDIFFWVAWFIILLLPHLNFIGLNAMFAEHWIYGAGVGVYAIFAILLRDLTQKRVYGRKIPYIFATGVIICFSSMTVMRNFDWRNEPSIYLSTLKYSRSPRVLSNLGVYYELHEEYDKAIELYKEALEKCPNATLYHNNIAVSYLKIGDVKKAVCHWERSLGLDSNQPEIKEVLRKYKR